MLVKLLPAKLDSKTNQIKSQTEQKDNWFYKFKGREVFDNKRGQLVTLDWNAGKKGMQKLWFFLSQLRFSQARSSINILM